MVAATAKPKKPKEASSPQTVLDIPVDFGGVSIGENTCRLGIVIEIKVCNVVAAYEAFCGHRLNGRVALGGSEDSSGQQEMFDDQHVQLSGSFDVKSINVKSATISTGLTWSKKDVSVEDLSQFAKGSGRLQIFEVAAIPKDAPADEHDSKDDHTPGQYKWDLDWRLFPLNQMFNGAIMKALIDANLENLGLLADFTRRPGSRLTDIAGIGPGKAETISNTVKLFYVDNPRFKDER